ncbi:Stage V sporulation protein B [Paenibacillus sp. CECT 9249]|uniref:oligosaccharide flippase family protein n=1 Tax=Paenibacillus sp. CECT 9249 TaxID=2845385 RepID=UPI001E4E3EE2|nr:oligosaccharide flippase family protein [Paenibacillus sp. CECT 9249]CAH0119355.1 Stage V sporulation protein B [Paenibacillus sp. CECT 9249]
MASSKLMKQMALRTSAIFLVKLIGFFARIPLFRMLGAEGIGRYQMVYSLYVVLLTFVTGGFPTSLALTTADDPAKGWRYFTFLSLILVGLGGVASFGCFVFAPQLASMLGDPGLAFAIRCLAPALLIVPVLSLIRGLLQGIEAYGYIAVSELIEQAVRVVLMLLLVSLLIGKGTAIAVSGTLLGAFAGATAAILFLILVLLFIPYPAVRRRKGKWSVWENGSGMRQLFQAGAVISLSRYIIPVSEFLDALIIPRRLQDSGLSFPQASAIFGEMFGIASTITYMPLIVTAALIHTLSAKFIADWHQGEGERFYRRVRFSFDIAMLWGIGASLTLFFYNRELSVLVFGDESAAIGIRYLAVAPLFAGLRELTSTALLAMGRRREILTGLIIALVASNVLNIVLVAIPGFGYQGIAIGMIVFEVIGVIWNLAVIRKHSGGKLQWNPFNAGIWIVLLLFFLQFNLSAILIPRMEMPQWFEGAVRASFSFLLIGIYILLRFMKNKHEHL